MQVVPDPSDEPPVPVGVAPGDGAAWPGRTASADVGGPGVAVAVTVLVGDDEGAGPDEHPARAATASRPVAVDTTIVFTFRCMLQRNTRPGDGSRGASSRDEHARDDEAPATPYERRRSDMQASTNRHAATRAARTASSPAPERSSTATSPATSTSRRTSPPASFVSSDIPGETRPQAPATAATRASTSSRTSRARRSRPSVRQPGTTPTRTSSRAADRLQSTRSAATSRRSVSTPAGGTGPVRGRDPLPLVHLCRGDRRGGVRRASRRPGRAPSRRWSPRLSVRGLRDRPEGLDVGGGEPHGDLLVGLAQRGLDVGLVRLRLAPGSRGRRVRAHAPSGRVGHGPAGAR